MQAVLVIWVLAIVRAYASEDLTAQASEITVEGSMKEFPFVLDHVFSESSLTGQKAEDADFMRMFLSYIENGGKVSGEDIGEESQEGSENTFQGLWRSQSSTPEYPVGLDDGDADFMQMLAWFAAERGQVSGEDIGEESQEGSGKEEKPVLEFDVPSDAIAMGSSLITSLVVTNDRKIVMVDYAQKEVKVASLDAPAEVGAGLSFDQTPWSLALLSDGLVAVSTEDERVLYIVNVSTPEPTLVSRVTTERAYRGIAPGPGDTLVVSSQKDPHIFSRATIDVISRDGHVIQTISDRRMVKPFFLSRFGDELYVSDWGSHRVYRVKLDSGNVDTMFNNLDLATMEMYQPRVVAIDEAGNMYVASGGRVCAEADDDDGWCVLVITRGGQWMNLVNFNGNHDTKWPYGISLTPTGIIVSWGRWSSGGWRSELTAYSLPSSTKNYEGEKPVLEFDVPSDAIAMGSSLITSLVVTNDRKIVMVDYAQKEIKVASLDAPAEVGAGLSFDQTPWSLALLSDGLVAVSTEDERVLYIVNVSTPEPTLVSRVTTERAYRGIAPGPGDTLVVSSQKDPHIFSRATIDVISRDGHVIRTISDRRMYKPFFLSRFGDELYVSDWGSHRVYRVKLDSGNVDTMFNNLDLATMEMYQPRVVAIDEAGNMYVASGGRVCAEADDDDGWCVLVITRGGQWMNLVNFNGSHDTKWPYGISLTPTGIVVSWGRWSAWGWRSELTAYSLPSSTKHHEGQLG